MQAAKNDLQGSGIHFSIKDDKGYLAEAYLPLFIRDIWGILELLGDGRK